MPTTGRARRGTCIRAWGRAEGVAVNVHEVAGRELHRMEHPCAAETTWDLLNEETRAWWVEKARPITDALRGSHDRS